jgi:hypothetical protein
LVNETFVSAPDGVYDAFYGNSGIHPNDTVFNFRESFNGVQEAIDAFNAEGPPTFDSTTRIFSSSVSTGLLIDKWNNVGKIQGPEGPEGPQGIQGILGARTYNVTNSGASAYVIDGAGNPTIQLLRGFTYEFNVDAVGHPF